jgi:hypothetical protein
MKPGLTSILHLRWLIADLKLEMAVRRLARKYRPDQSRDDQGRWVGEGRTGDVRKILSTARRLIAASGTVSYQRCLDLCYPLLERSKPLGSDRNTWDFFKCMNACLGRK